MYYVILTNIILIMYLCIKSILFIKYKMVEDYNNHKCFYILGEFLYNKDKQINKK